jgi:hypothetical protein
MQTTLQQPWVQSPHPPTPWNLKGAADKAVLITVFKKMKNKPQNLKNNYGSSAANHENRRADTMSSLYLLF